MSHDHFVEASLNDDMNANIPVLHEAIDPDWPSDEAPTTGPDGIVTLSLGQAILDEVITPTEKTSNAAASNSTSQTSARNPLSNPAKPVQQKSQNPFLPQHILDRLNHGKRNLVEEIAQSGAALDASTAMLRNRALADSAHRPFSNASSQPYVRDKNAHKKQQLIDDLVDEYLPLLAAELRRRLRKVLDE